MRPARVWAGFPVPSPTSSLSVGNSVREILCIQRNACSYGGRRQLDLSVACT